MRFHVVIFYIQNIVNKDYIFKNFKKLHQQKAANCPYLGKVSFLLRLCSAALLVLKCPFF